MKPILFSIILLFSFSNSAISQNIDIQLLREINLNRSSRLDGFMYNTSQSVYPVAAAIPISEFFIGIATKNRNLQHTAIQSATALGMNYVVAFGLKKIVDRPRPFESWDEIITYGPKETDASFPSGHTSFAFNAATSLTLTFPKWYVAVPAFTWAAMVGYSRMHIGMHYPTDVLAGAIIGAGTSWLAWKGNKFLQGHFKKKLGKH